MDIGFTSLNLSAPDKTSFRYRLGRTRDRLDLDDRFNRKAHYTRLAPNHYTFQVQACNEDGVWSTADATLALTVLPPFWHTWWFITLTSAGFLGLVVSFVHYVSTQRLQRQLEGLRQKEALEKERARIARDIHDQVGANLTQVSLLGRIGGERQGAPGGSGRSTRGRFRRPRWRRPARWMRLSGRSTPPTTPWTG